MFTPAEIGFWERESTYKVAQVLGEPVNMAGAYILRVRELFVLHADKRGRLPAEFDAFAIARRADFKGAPRRLIKAFGAAKLLVFSRRRYVHPDFARTEAGRYAEYREWDRNRQRDRRRRVAEGLEQSNESNASTGRPVDVQRTDRSKAESGAVGADSPPGAPPEGGDGGASARWEWFRETYPRLRNLKRTRQLLDELCAEDERNEPQIRYCLGLQGPRYMSLMRKGKGHFVPFSDVWLSKGTFWEHRKPKPKEAPPPPDPVELELKRRQEEAKQRLDDRAHREMVAFGYIKKQLQEEGYRGFDLIKLADARLEEWRQQNPEDEEQEQQTNGHVNGEAHP